MSAVFGGGIPGNTGGGRMLEDGVTWQYDDGTTYVNPTKQFAQMTGADIVKMLGANTGMATPSNTPSTVSYSPAPAPAPTYAQPGQAAWGGSTPAPSGTPAPAPSSGGAVWGGTNPNAPTPAPSPAATPSPAPAPSTSGMPVFNLANAPAAGPSAWTVDENQTVAGQLAQVLASDSPLMQQARTRALQRAEAAGLRNSSLAASAGEAAMIDAALPVAQADATMYGTAGQFNAGQQNTFLRDSNQFARDGAMANFNLAANNWAADEQLRRDLIRDQANTAQTTAAEEATLKRGYINALNQARTDYAEKFAAISSNTNMSAELKKETLDGLKVAYNTMIRNYAGMLGWDPASWLIGTASAAGPAPAPSPGTAPAPSPSTAAPPGVSQDLWNTATGGGGY